MLTDLLRTLAEHPLQPGMQYVSREGGRVHLWGNFADVSCAFRVEGAEDDHEVQLVEAAIRANVAGPAFALAVAEERARRVRQGALAVEAAYAVNEAIGRTVEAEQAERLRDFDAVVGEVAR